MTHTQPKDRGAFGLFAGAVTGGALVAIWFMIMPALMPMTGDAFAPSGGQLLSWGLVTFVIATFVFAVGLVTIGLPGWWVLHKLGLRGPLAGALWGATATFLTTAGLDLNSHRVVFFELGDFLLTLDGAIVGLVIQRLTYRPAKPKPPPAPPSAAPTP